MSEPGGANRLAYEIDRGHDGSHAVDARRIDDRHDGQLILCDGVFAERRRAVVGFVGISSPGCERHRMSALIERQAAEV